jgi:LysM repeat protein
MFAIRIGSGLALMAVVLAASAFALTSAARGEGASPSEDYVVRAGDTLWSIADGRYSGDLRKAVWQIRRANDLGTRSIVVGETLELPAR